ncbi:MAG: xanthine dehydrogenase accessory protein XdhC, partial [Pseudooceanicola sp.]|nr:xanthine dehydrogenase accessory protein XdhC [Pseudooceanicola sp.]
IGGGALEFVAARRALEGDRLERHPLGPSLGQCCGGAVTLLTEVFDPARVAALAGPVIARPAPGAGEMPLAVRRLLADARGAGQAPEPQLIDGWMVEAPAHRSRDLWVWGAGHVGRALVAVLAPLPGMRVTWVDTGPDRFPSEVPEGVTVLPAADPARLVAHAPPQAEHLILTYSHALDLELCHRLLAHGFAAAGLIGSNSKWARFRSRLSALGHTSEHIARIRCPIGDPGLGKHPQAIAVGVAAELLRPAKPQERSLRA